MVHSTSQGVQWHRQVPGGLGRSHSCAHALAHSHTHTFNSSSLASRSSLNRAFHASTSRASCCCWCRKNRAISPCTMSSDDFLLSSSATRRSSINSACLNTRCLLLVLAVASKRAHRPSTEVFSLMRCSSSLSRLMVACFSAISCVCSSCSRARSEGASAG